MPQPIISRSTRVPAYAALLTVQALFGTLPVIGKVVLAVMPSTALVGFRVGIATLVLFIFQKSRGNLKLADPADYVRLAVLSLFGVTLNQLLFVGGLSLTKAANTSLLAVTIPIFTLIAGVIAGSELLRLRNVIGVLVAAGGVLILIDPRYASFSSTTTLGDILIILNSLSYGIYVATSKDVVTRNGAFRSITWIFIFSSLICVPLGLFSLSTVGVNEISASIWLLVIYIALAATAAPYLLNAWALARVSPSTVAVFIYLQPLIGFTAAALFLGERLTVSFFAAAALIFAGVYLSMRRETISPAGRS